MSDIDDQPSKPVRVAQGSNGAINVLSDEEITSENNYGYSRTFPDGEGELQSQGDGAFRQGLNALLASLFDDEFYLDRYATFKSASAGFLLLTLFTQNCTQLRLLVLAKNRDDYIEHIGLWRALIFFMSLVVVMLVIAAVVLFIISMLPLENSNNTRVLVRLNTILTVVISITCLLNILASTMIFAESKETFYQPQPQPQVIDMDDGSSSSTSET